MRNLLYRFKRNWKLSLSAMSLSIILSSNCMPSQIEPAGRMLQFTVKDELNCDGASTRLLKKTFNLPFDSDGRFQETYEKEKEFHLLIIKGKVLPQPTGESRAIEISVLLQRKQQKIELKTIIAAVPGSPVIVGGLHENKVESEVDSSCHELTSFEITLLGRTSTVRTKPPLNFNERSARKY